MQSKSGCHGVVTRAQVRLSAHRRGAAVAGGGAVERVGREDLRATPTWDGTCRHASQGGRTLWLMLAAADPLMDSDGQGGHLR